MEKVRPWCGQPSDRGRLRNRTEHPSTAAMRLMANYFDHLLSLDTPTYTVAQIAKRFEPSTVLWAYHTIQPSSLSPPCIAGCGHIYFRPVSIFLSFFLALSQRLQIGCLPYFHTWCGLSANLGCMSLLHTARCKYRTQKNRHFGTIAQLCRAVSSQLRQCIDNPKKNLLNNDTSPAICPPHVLTIW